MAGTGRKREPPPVRNDDLECAGRPCEACPARCDAGAAFSGEGRGNRFLASRVSRAARLPRAGPGSGGPRPARCDSVPVPAGTPSHRAGYGGGGAARNRAADGTAEADADGEAPGNRRPGRVLIRQRPLQKSRTHVMLCRSQAPVPGGAVSHSCRPAPGPAVRSRYLRRSRHLPAGGHRLRPTAHHPEDWPFSPEPRSGRHSSIRTSPGSTRSVPSKKRATCSWVR
jgi:hypothetical protein